MRGSLGHMLYEVNRMKREGTLPPDYTPFTPKVLAVSLGISLGIVALLYGASLLLG